MSIKNLITLITQNNLRAVRKTKNKIPYVRVMATLDQVSPLLDRQGLVYEQVSVDNYPITGAARFYDAIFKITYSSGDVIIKVTPAENVVQKILAPNNLRIENKLYTDAAVLKQDIIVGLNSCGASSDTVISCINILNAIENDSDIVLTDTLRNSKDKSKITSDFGEVVLAFRRLVTQGGDILFPVSSNQPDFDFFHNGVPISAKGSKGSSRYLIGGNKEIAAYINNLGDSNIERMFKAWHNRDMPSVFEHAAPDCPEINWWKQKLQRFTQESILSFTQKHTWEQFVQFIKDSQNGGLLGIPDEKKNRTTYESGDTNPLMFALLTIWARYYTVHNSQQFNDLACEMHRYSESKIIFEFFNYDTNGKVLISNQAITTYDRWDIRYHGNASKSLNNYPALEGLR